MIGKWIQKIKKNKRQLGVGVLALLLVGVMGVNLLQNSTSTVYANGEPDITVDNDTSNSWNEIANNSNSTQNVGRIWTDKSVFNEDYHFQGALAGNTIEKGDNDFLVGLSAIASSSNQRTTVSSTTPLDVVLVLDDSGSMDENFGDAYWTYNYYEVNANDVVESHGHFEDGPFGSQIPVQDSEAGDYYALVGEDYVQIQEITEHYGGIWGYDEHIRWELNGQTITPDSTQFYRRENGQYHPAPSRTEALQNAVNSFIDKAAETNLTITDEANKIRISIVVFASDSEIENNLTICEGNNVNNLKRTVNSLRGNGATNAGAGMSDANQVLRHSDRDADQVVIFFTDGVPTTSSSFSNSVANTAVENARAIKMRGGNVYSIGIFDGADPSITNGNSNSPDTVKANTFMNAVSSNYPNASSWYDLGSRVDETSEYYKTATDSSELNKIFEDIFDESTEDIASGSPIEEEISEGATRTPGNLTFTDQLGNYMEVTGDTMYLAFADGIHEGTSNDNGNTWHFTGSFDANEVYPAGDLSEIQISVDKSGLGDRVTVTIPASLIPMRHYNVDANTGQLTISDAYPVRLFYGVSLKQEAKTAMQTATGSTYDSILNTQKSTDNKYINFYSNDFNASQSTALTTATFTPSDGNKFYYYTEDTQLYLDSSFTTPATRFNEDQWGDTLYYRDTYWTTGSTEEITTAGEIHSNGEEWNAITNSGNNVIIPRGTHRYDRPSGLVMEKDPNTTGTASNVITPSWGTGETVIVSLGNNGRIAYETPGELSIAKTVDWGNASSETQEDKNNFEFTVELYNSDDTPLPGEYSYYDSGDENKELGKISSSNNTITVQQDQKIVIPGLPAGTKYKVKETMANRGGFKTEDNSTGDDANTTDGIVEGEILAAQESTTVFKNTYNATSAELLGKELNVQKVLTGRDWRESDSFEFVISGSRGPSGTTIPMPENKTISIDYNLSSQNYINTFGNIKFVTPGEYRYVIEENGDPENPIVGINYSDAIYRATVTVNDNGNGALEIGSVKIERMYNDDGSLSNTENEGVVVDPGTPMTFTNEYNASVATQGIKGRKSYTDEAESNPIDAGKFNFRLEAQGGFETNVGSSKNLTISAADTPMPQSAIGNAVSTSNIGETFTFETITFNGNHAGNTYVYKVSEIKGSENGMSYDAIEHTIMIQVDEVVDADGTHINARVLPPYDNPANLVFTNTYDPNDAVLSGNTSIHGTKQLTGRDIQPDEKFYFTLSANDDNAKTVLENPKTVEVASLNDDGVADFDFGEMSFSREGQYTFKVDETTADGSDTADVDNGLTFDTNVCTVIVDVKDDDSGTLKASVSYSNNMHADIQDKALFINNYESNMNYGAQGAGGIEITKVLENHAMDAGDFTFHISGADSGTVTAEEANEKLADEDRTFTNGQSSIDIPFMMKKLQSVTFNQDDAGKIFSFIVDEEEPSTGKLAGVSYDQRQYRVDIEVYDNGDGTMYTLTTVTEGSTVIIDKANSNNQVPSFGFTNTYTPGSVSLDGENAIKAQKTLNGKDWNNDHFTFTVSPANETTSSAVANGDVIMPQDNSVTIDDNTADHKASFGTITFNKEGSYVFNVTEEVPEGAVENGDGTWTINGITYDSTPVRVRIVVEDNLEGSLVVTSVSYNGDQNKDAAEFVNTYKANGSTSVSVTKNLTGRDWMNEDSFDFTLEIDKTHEATLNAFENNQISIDGANDEGVANISISSADESKTKAFGNINFNDVENGEYRFIVKETLVNDEYYLNGIKYSQAEYLVAVTVNDNGSGTLELTSLITQQLNDDGVEGNKGTDYESAVFTNKYTSDSVTLTGDTAIHGTKTLTGRNSNPNEKFNFKLTEDENNDKTGYEIVENGNVASVDTLKEGESAKFNFGDITFIKNGTYTFYVSENIPENAVNNVLDGVTYDSHVETVSVNVTEDYANHTLVAEVTYDQDGVAFTNTYDASASTGVPTEFSLTKVFEGKTWTTEDVFEFTLTAGENTAGIETPMPANPTVQVNAPTEEDGKTAKFDFGSISYDTVGDYHYTVTEVQGNNPGINYSENTASIIVHVSDNQHGGLVATAEVENGIFTNTYSSELDYGAQGGLQLVKNLTGHDLGDGQFGFTLNAEDSISIDKLGQESVVVGNTADDMDENGLSTSTITLLDNLKFTQKDVDKTYTYTVRETKGGSDGYTNDETIYTVKITTEDNGSGTLTVRTHITGTNGTDKTYEYSQSKTRAETGVAQIVFENTYKSTTDGGDEYDNSVTLTGTKELTGRPMVDGEFSFQVLNSKGQVVSEATNGANGEVVFNPIHYTNTQLISDAADKIAQRNGNKYTYVYTVNEVTPVDEGTSIVKGSFTVTVNVTDNGDGTLTTDIVLPEGGLAFKNAYGTSANAEVGINGTKYLDNNGTNAPDITGKYTFTITGSDGAPMPAVTTATNDASGYIDFGTITYTMENVFGDAGQQSIVEQSDEALVDETTNDETLAEENVTGSEEIINTYSEQRTKTFTYTITETGSVTGVTNDPANSKAVEVTVTDNGDGTISVSSTQLTFSFTNTYTPDPTDPTSPTDSSVTIKKTLEGKKLSEKEFIFNMLNEAGEVVSTGTNTADGSVTLSGLTFDKVGTYNFTIAEVNDNKGGVEYDSTEYKAIAYVEDDATGKLKVSWEVTDAQGNKINMIEFKNTYSVNPTSLTLGATKVLEGRELGDKEFLFVLSDEEGNVVEEAYNDATGKVEFSELVFDKAGTYNYTVTEKNTGAKGITYDDSVYNIQVEVVDNGNGTLNMKTTTTKDGEVASIVFRNKAEKDSVPEQPEKDDTSNTSTKTYAGLFTSLAVDAVALAGIATLLKKRNAKK